MDMKKRPSTQIVFKSLSNNWVSITVVVITLVLTSLLSLISPIIYKVLIDDVIPNKDRKGLVALIEHYMHSKKHLKKSRHLKFSVELPENAVE